jgi:hypothetical protein
MIGGRLGVFQGGLKLNAAGWILEVEVDVVRLVSLAMNLKSIRRAVVFSTVLVAALATQAQTFTYNSDDLLVCFRVAPNGGVNDLVVDCGPVSTFTNLAAGQKIIITTNYYTVSQLANVGTGAILWSAFACDRHLSAPSYVNLWMTKPRTDVNTQTSPWNPNNFSVQGAPASRIDSIGSDATDIGLSLAAGPNNTTTALVEPESGHTSVGQDDCYSFYVGSTGNFANNFQGDVEQTMTNNNSRQVVRSDFYQMLSTNSTLTAAQAIKYLGYFEFSTNGALTYTAGPSPAGITKPVITAFTRNQNTNTVTFTTGSSGTYNLCGTNVLTVSTTNWPVITSVTGNGSPQSLIDVTTNGQKFYIISAQ